jgi:hypothetical protein
MTRCCSVGAGAIRRTIHMESILITTRPFFGRILA